MAELKQVVPYKDHQLDKKTQVSEMFDNISKRYDFLNHFLSLGIDIYWRKQLFKELKKSDPKFVLDVATGTGDLAIGAIKNGAEKVIGLDISDGMLEIGRKKMNKRGISDRVEMINGDSENLPFPDNNFDAVIVAFGVRNFANLEKGIRDMSRVLKPGGTMQILEFSTPTLFPFAEIYNLYFKYVLPRVGKLISKDSSAYTYLPESVGAFPDGEKFLKILESCGLKDLKIKPLTLGVCSLFSGTKY